MAAISGEKKFSDRDHAAMARALDLAWSVKGKTFPNPAVGAVVTKGKIELGVGATTRCGGPHAERTALAQAGEKARGATLYATLEPCCHFGRTPPCTDAIIAAGIRRVVVGPGDPNPVVNGKGIARLKAAGIRVERYPADGTLKEINEDFFYAVTHRAAWITIKLACTLDGRIADDFGDSRWITGTEARRFAHELRRRHAAVAVGRTTLEHDNPRLTVRHLSGFAPARCVFASKKELPVDSFFKKHAGDARSIVIIPGGTSKTIIRDDNSPIEYWYTGRKKTMDHFAVFREMAWENGLTSVLVEGGSKLASAFLETGMVNRIYLFYGNKLVGRGVEGVSFSRGLPVNRCLSLKSRRLLDLGDTFGITGIPELHN